MSETSVTVKLSGEVHSAEDLETLAEMIDHCDLAPASGIFDAISDAASSGQPLSLTADEVNFSRLSEFERGVHGLGLDVVVTTVGRGETMMTVWRACASAPTEIRLDPDGGRLLDAEIVRSLASLGHGHLLSYLSEIDEAAATETAAFNAPREMLAELAGMVEPTGPFLAS